LNLTNDKFQEKSYFWEWYPQENFRFYYYMQKGYYPIKKVKPVEPEEE